MSIIGQKNKKNKIANTNKLADNITNTLGSWNFIIVQSVIIIFWIVLNIFQVFKFDSFPFVFLNLALSFQAAFTAPIIMMSQNRQSEQDRINMKQDYEINILAEKEIVEINKHLEDIKNRLSGQNDVGQELLGIQKRILDYHKAIKR